MSGFLYFLPTEKRAVTADDFKAAGLGHALRDNAGISAVHTLAGPGNAAGVVCCVDGDGTPKYDPVTQTWRKGPNGAYHVGFANDARPAPEDLVRERVYDGAAVRLLDGNQWIIPRCFAVLDDRPPTLPRVLDFDEDGETLLSRVHPRYADLCERAFELWMEWSAQRPLKSTNQWRVRLAADALGVNYRLGPIEAVALLNLLATDEVGLILRAVIDADAVEEFAKAQSQKKS